MIIDFKAGISGKNNRLLMAAIHRLFFQHGEAQTILVDSKPVPGGKDIFTDWPHYHNDIFMQWESKRYLSIMRDDIVWFGGPGWEIQPQEVLAWLQDLPFELASFGTSYPDWLNPIHPYEAPSFSQFHLPHGWASAFKGAGFRRLVSRRWLDFGPWKQHKGTNDTQLIQFHQLDIDATQALDQAKPGHQMMGIDDEGGFIQKNYVYKFDNKGLYVTDEKKLKVIVHGSDISARQMLDACAARHYQALGADKPLDNVAYVFMEEEKAVKHLHPIWLRGLECRTIRAGKEIRLDDTYQPKPIKPDWIQE
jgi:hypothetical protein